MTHPVGDLCGQYSTTVRVDLDPPRVPALEKSELFFPKLGDRD
jgi:hypothetical protein